MSAKISLKEKETKKLSIGQKVQSVHRQVSIDIVKLHF